MGGFICFCNPGPKRRVWPREEAPKQLVKVWISRKGLQLICVSGFWGSLSGSSPLARSEEPGQKGPHWPGVCPAHLPCSAAPWPPGGRVRTSPHGH